MPLLWQKSSAYSRDVSLVHPRIVGLINYLEELEDVVPHIEVHKLRVQTPEVRIVDVLEYQRRCFALTVPHHVQERNDIRSS